MEPAVFNKFREIVYEMSGITLGPGKEALVSARVGKRMRMLGISDYRDYLDYVVKDGTGEEIVHLIDAISTNVTSFYRESVHFDFLSQAMEQWLAKGQRRFRFWSAACSSGEEPYTMAITLLEATARHDADVKILATDISTKILHRSSEGIYTKDRVQTVPSMLRDRYFERKRNGDDTLYVVKPALRNLITFKRLNLSQPPFPMQGPMDAIFCRNVMIYFDNRVRSNLLADAYRLLKPGGYLFVGHAESLTGMVSSFKTVRPSIYVRPS